MIKNLFKRRVILKEKIKFEYTFYCLHCFDATNEHLFEIAVKKLTDDFSCNLRNISDLNLLNKRVSGDTKCNIPYDKERIQICFDSDENNNIIGNFGFDFEFKGSLDINCEIEQSYRFIVIVIKPDHQIDDCQRILLSKILEVWSQKFLSYKDTKILFRVA